MGLLEEYLCQCEEIIAYECELKDADASKYNELAIEAERQEVQILWTDWKESYKKCMTDPDCTKEDKITIKKKKIEVHDSYIRSVAIIGEWKDSLKKTSAVPIQKTATAISVPPCDTEIFYGDYLAWPSFRDLFTAIYVNNKKLSPVEKLYHLFQKTSGEAREINMNIPLTAEGFEIAWENLKSQYENKRMLVNNQLRTLFNLSQCTQENANGLKKLQRDITNVISVLKVMKIDIGSWGPIFIYQCTSKLPRLTLSLWEQSIARKTEIPVWEDLDKFLTDRFQALESVSDILGGNDTGPRQKFQNSERSKQFKVHHTKVNNQKCCLCKGLHVLKSCPKFLSMDWKNRLSVVKKCNSCLNCLAQGHMVVACQSKNTCSKCYMKHHTLLHKNMSPQVDIGTNALSQSTQNKNIQSADLPMTSSNVKSFHTSVANKTMLATAWVKIVKDGESHRLRALIDPCSDDTFISSKIQKLLKLPTRSISADITGLGGEAIVRCSKVAFFTISSIDRSKFSMAIDALVVKDVTGNVPTYTFDTVSINNLPKLNYADPDFYKSGPVDILLGGNLYPFILLKGVEHGILGSLVAQQTVFGWIVTGPTNKSPSNQVVRVSHCTRVSINEQMAKFWEIEEISTEKTVSEEDKLCEKIYQRTTIRRSDGRYVVDLPFKTAPPLHLSVHSNRYVALTQYLRNEKSLSKKSDLKLMYDDVIQEYLTLGHMEQVDAPNKDSEDYFYLPHHGIFRPESATTKLRVVFNASCPSVNGKSLNDFLYVGPVLQKDIISLILNWRLYKYVFNADVSNMYRQILINPKHAPYQRILFRTSTDEEIKDFQLRTVTFGVNCAPYLALRTLLQLADDEANRFPLGAKILRENMYVDDALVGTHTVPECIEARKQLADILMSAGFELRKWTSNSKEILSGLPRDHLLNCDFLNFDDKSIAKTLGIRWNAISDSFYFVTEKIQNKNAFTKREVLSVIARLFDPLGWLAPVVINAKVLMQQLWLDDLEWDDPLKPLALVKWKKFVENYGVIDSINIPRWIEYSPQCKMEFHGFCDSSELAYAATLYARIEIDSNTTTSLLVSKTRVAPLRKLSLPRLELCGALLLSELIQAFLPQLQIDKSALFLWSDSTIVLSWLKKPSYNWTTFVANRVSKIHNRVGSGWRHVPTHDNPSDLATRGLTPLELKENTMWWYGPPWLRRDTSLWPSNLVIPETNLESKPLKAHIARSDDVEDILERFSCLSRAMHVVGYIFRFWNSTHPASRKKCDFSCIRLSNTELSFVRKRLMVLSQTIYFSKDYNCLAKKRPLDAKSCLLTLTPFIDKDRLLRANGRLGSTLSLAYNERHPIILSHKSRFAKLYIDFIHKLTLHGGLRLMVATIRLECWVIRAKNIIRTHIHNCKECVIARRHLQNQLMSSLPPERTTWSRPFTNSGVDFAGPFDIKTFSGRGCRMTKGYICLFVCFATKAIHLEAVSDLSTPAFLAALTRFTSRRGCPNKIYSDNGRNFVGAAKEIKENFLKIIREVKDEANARYRFQKLEWHFIPASAPHMGGLWEAGVKSCKSHLKKIAGQVKHTFEEFSTILSYIESCLNSRPLTPLSEDIDNLGALTPGHFLIGSSLLSPAEPEVFPSQTALLNRWRRLKVIQHEFCRRWKSEYLKEIQKRNKWKLPQNDLRENDLVVLRHEAGGPNDWRLGRVTKIYHGPDNRVRVVDLKTQSGIITRPIHKLVLLPRTL